MYKSEKYLKDVRGHACLVCGNIMVDAHHPGTSVTGKQRGFGLKRCGDDLAVPLCRTDHMIAHSKGKEIQFWLDYGIDPIEWAEKNFKRWKSSQ